MIKIVDNFFKDPYAVRNDALSLQSSFKVDSQIRWPGMRVEVTDHPILEYVAKRIRIDTNSNVRLRQGFFQLIDTSWTIGTCHADHPDTYSSIIFLNPYPPSNSGTEIYHGIRRWDPPCPVTIKAQMFELRKRKYYESNKTFIDRFLFTRDAKKYNSTYKDPCVVSNKFNRMVVFDSRMSHRGQNYFGTNFSNTRLTLVSFFTHDQ